MTVFDQAVEAGKKAIEICIELGGDGDHASMAAVAIRAALPIVREEIAKQSFEIGFNTGTVEELHALCDALNRLSDLPTFRGMLFSAVLQSVTASLRHGGVARFSIAEHGIPATAAARLSEIMEAK